MSRIHREIVFRLLRGFSKSRIVLNRFGKLHLIALISLLTLRSIVGGTWAPLATAPPTGVNCCMLLGDGTVLVAPVSQFGGCVIYNVNGNSWQTAASSKNQNEVCWVKLANDNILTIDTGAQTSEHYVPSLNTWIVDGNVPVPVYGIGAEIGGGFLLPNGTVFYI